MFFNYELVQVYYEKISSYKIDGQLKNTHSYMYEVRKKIIERLKIIKIVGYFSFFLLIVKLINVTKIIMS